jgi:hypothetical protein
VVEGTKALEHENMYKRMMLVQWIEEFNGKMKENDYPLDIVF